MINVSQLPNPQVLVALPGVREPTRISTPVPSIRSYYAEYFASMNRPAPRLLDAAAEGLWHEGSEIEVLLLPISYETWCEMTTWIRNHYGHTAALTALIRVYGERHQIRTYKNNQYLIVTSSRFEEIAKVQAFSAYCWGKADIYSLVDRDKPEPVEEQVLAPLPQAQNRYIERPRITTQWKPLPLPTRPIATKNQ